mmetsp:Transcript_26603/g.62496  ORF Transcript_26603/g.62496 Transcript_26603/m.62496 type:complete len:285 (+) Transcript_26603:658-1512(+)
MERERQRARCDIRGSHRRFSGDSRDSGSSSGSTVGRQRRTALRQTTADTRTHRRGSRERPAGRGPGGHVGCLDGVEQASQTDAQGGGRRGSLSANPRRVRVSGNQGLAQIHQPRDSLHLVGRRRSPHRDGRQGQAGRRVQRDREGSSAHLRPRVGGYLRRHQKRLGRSREREGNRRCVFSRGRGGRPIEHHRSRLPDRGRSRPSHGAARLRRNQGRTRGRGVLDRRGGTAAADRFLRGQGAEGILHLRGPPSRWPHLHRRDENGKAARLGLQEQGVGDDPSGGR